ncbi:unnamed protein product [Prorocentrum cordatum]|uniref:Uncharacterized protein n=1 Tax=Prorocentrum cordatum TaxID=2364126 RepID=A0ABN9WGF1_9DINO|nr:unnamed protein product [Polarella glacialis]
MATLQLMRPTRTEGRMEALIQMMLMMPVHRLGWSLAVIVSLLMMVLLMAVSQIVPIAMEQVWKELTDTMAIFLLSLAVMVIFLLPVFVAPGIFLRIFVMPGAFAHWIFLLGSVVLGVFVLRILVVLGIFLRIFAIPGALMALVFFAPHGAMRLFLLMSLSIPSIFGEQGAADVLLAIFVVPGIRSRGWWPLLPGRMIFRPIFAVPVTFQFISRVLGLFRAPGALLPIFAMLGAVVLPVVAAMGVLPVTFVVLVDLGALGSFLPIFAVLVISLPIFAVLELSGALGVFWLVFAMLAAVVLRILAGTGSSLVMFLVIGVLGSIGIILSIFVALGMFVAICTAMPISLLIFRKLEVFLDDGGHVPADQGEGLGQAGLELVDIIGTLERAVNLLSKHGAAMLQEPKGVSNVVQAISAMVQASVFSSADAKRLASFAQATQGEEDVQPLDWASRPAVQAWRARGRNPRRPRGRPCLLVERPRARGDVSFEIGHALEGPLSSSVILPVCLFSLSLSLSPVFSFSLSIPSPAILERVLHIRDAITFKPACSDCLVRCGCVCVGTSSELRRARRAEVGKEPRLKSGLSLCGGKIQK